MGKALFITGTGTDIGKTYVTGLIVKRLKEAGLCGLLQGGALGSRGGRGRHASAR